MIRPAALLALAALAGCAPEEGPLMSPGDDCLDCHSGGEAKAWTVAGTMGHQGSHLSITDATGWSFTLRANKVGNFYTAERVTFPLRVAVDGQPMTNPVQDGSCNRCHGNGPGSGGGGGG